MITVALMNDFADSYHKKDNLKNAYFLACLCHKYHISRQN